MDGIKDRQNEKDKKLLSKLINRGRTNLCEWCEKLDHDFIQENSIEEFVFVDELKKIFYNNLTDQFPCALLTIMFKFLIDKGVGHIFEP